MVGIKLILQLPPLKANSNHCINSLPPLTSAYANPNNLALRTHLPQNPSTFPRSIFFTPKNPSFHLLVISTMSTSSSKVIAEYAQVQSVIVQEMLEDNRCKNSEVGFSHKRLVRLRYDQMASLGLSSIEFRRVNWWISIAQGFSSADQEALKKLMEHGDQCEEKVTDGAKDTVKTGKEIFSKIHDGDGDEDEDEENQCSKKKKFSPALADLSFSMDDIKDKYKDARLLPKWKAFQTIIFLERDEGLNDSSKIAAFDFDGCLVNTSVKRVGADAWSLMYPSIPERLRSLYNDGYKLVIFTNESNIGRWTKKRQVAVDSKLGRLNNFIKKVELPIQVFIACGMGKSGGGKVDDPYRKPEPGMWRIMDQCFNSGIPIDMDQSFYVGDAAGRPDDHSDADIGFAKAIGLKFYVPEEYFESN